MKQPGGHSMRARRTQPALPGATLPTAPIIAQHQQQRQTPTTIKRPNYGQRALRKLLGLGILLEVLYLALYPLLAGVTPQNDAAKQALLGLFPWLPRLYWTTAFPAVAENVARIPWFNPLSAATSATNTGSGNANLLLVLLLVAFVCTLFAARIGRRVVQRQLSRTDGYLLFWAIFLLTGLFSITFLYVPAVMSQDMFHYSLFARMVAIYHMNPYLVSLFAFRHDLFYLKGMQGTAPYGPLWLDLSITLVLLAHESVANVLVGFRMLGLVAHLANVVLIWVILAKLKPEVRISSTVLYAWNPFVLLLSIGEMHLDVVVVLFVLLAVLLYQRHVPVLSWMFLLLAVLVNALCLLLLPLFFRLFLKEAQLVREGQRIHSWSGLTGVTIMVVFAAYLPYWQGWGLAGIAAQLCQAFLQNTAINSLDAAFLNLSITPLSPVAWLTVPHHWTVLAIMTVSILLFFGLWLADTLELALMFSSWLFLALLVLLPTYWGWYILLPLALAITSTTPRTILLAILLTLGAILSYYYWLSQTVWPGQALVTIGLPLLIWGWTLFFTSTWQMTHDNEEAEPLVKPTKGISRPSLPSRWLSSYPSRPSLPSRPSWPYRRR